MLLFGEEFFKFLATLDIGHQDDLKNRINSSFSSNHPGVIHPIIQIVLVQHCTVASAGRNLINSVPLTAATILAFSLCSIYPSSMLSNLPHFREFRLPPIGLPIRDPTGTAAAYTEGGI